MYYVYFRVSVHNSAEHEKALLLVNPHTPRQPLEQSITHTLRGVLNSDLSSSVVSVCGVLLPKLEDGLENGVTNDYYTKCCCLLNTVEPNFSADVEC